MRQFQTPERIVFQVGDVITFRLEAPGAPAGNGYVRTSIGRAAVRRRELIRHTEEGHLLDGLSWRDLEMKHVAPGVFELTLSLIEVGVFEAKCFFREDGQEKIRWPEGGNFRIKVECAANVGCNTMYCAFVRQFRSEAPPAPGEKAAVELLDRADYVVIPPSGTFRALIRRLDHIFDTLGCRILQLLPIHPAPTSYGRMGRFGSPFASLDYFAVDPALAEFDKHATVLEQFEELIDAVHHRRGRIFLDIPVNHTGWGSKLQNDHPEYFVREADGRFESPGAWGTVWEDLCKLNYRDRNVHRLMAEVFLYWSRLGVDGFRCDAGYMLPADAWDYIVSKVREEFPDVVFMLEGLGGKIEVQEHLLGNSGLDWAYSELFQNYSRDEIAAYQPYIERCSKSYGTLVNFAETHDNSRLAAVSPRYAAMRCALTALLSEAGAFGFANGVEFFADAKIDVHGASPLRWGASPNLIAPLRRLHAVLGEVPAFYAEAKVELVQTGDGNVIAALRSSPGHAPVLAAVNLDCERAAAVHWEAARFAAEGDAIDLLSGEKTALRREGNLAGIELPPGGAALLTFDSALLDRIEAVLASPACEPELVTCQRARAAGYAIWERLAPGTLPDFDVARVLRYDPMRFCQLAAGSDLAAVTRYRVGSDERRIFPIASEELLLLECDTVFRAAISFGGKRLRTVSSLPREGGKGEFALLTLPRNPEKRRRELVLELTVFDAPGATRRRGTLLELGDNKLVRCRMRVPGDRVRELASYAFAANHRGGMTLSAAAWGELNSKYDAILAGNGAAPYPVDRRTMFTRCRAWLVADAYSHEIDLKTLDSFTQGENNRAQWDFLVPAGQGRLAALRIELLAALDGDAVILRFSRFADQRADADAKCRIILRPDIENRVNHELTKAYLGAE
ncbi:MAG: alpha-amylase family glycosyl hydrolase, partial [Victivallaceae bacterium]